MPLFRMVGAAVAFVTANTADGAFVVEFKIIDVGLLPVPVVVGVIVCLFAFAVEYNYFNLAGVIRPIC